MARILTVPGKLRSRRSIKRFFIVSSWIFVFHELYTLLVTHRSTLPFATPSQQSAEPDYILPPHPIRTRLDSARQRWQTKLKSQSMYYGQFKATYRRKYKLEPPQGMREWFKIVTTDGVLLVDEFDELMASLDPFRAMGPEELHRRTLEVAAMPTFSLLNITQGHAYFYGQNYREDFQHYSRENYGPGIERVEGLASMMQRHIHRVPSGLIFAVSELAEPRVIVPWQDHPKTLRSFDLATSSLQKRDYNLRLTTPSLQKLLPTPAFGENGNSWELYAKSCPPESAARKNLLSLTPENAPKQHQDKVPDDKNNPVQAKRGKAKTGLLKRRAAPAAAPAGSWPSNYTTTGFSVSTIDIAPGPQGGYPSASSLIEDSDEFTFVEPGTSGLTHEQLCRDSELHQTQGAFFSDWRSLPALYPVFSPSKIDGYSDILIPSNFYYGDDARYTFQSNETIAWEDKKTQLFWRGKTTGGGNSPPGHQLQYQRHRFVRLAGRVSNGLKSLLIPEPGTGLIRHVKRTISELNKAWLDVGFTGYTGCGDPDICALTRQLCPLKKTVPIAEMAKYKAILDLDGMAFSGRFVALMNMGSGVVKSTIYKDALTEWIEPWVHYIPLSGGYSELYNLLAYFMPLSADKEENKSQSWIKRLWNVRRSKKTEGDGQLKQVADDGLKWSESIGNKPDIEAYVYRLSLEWGRLMGLIGDEEIDPDEEMPVEPESIFDALNPDLEEASSKKGEDLK